MLSFQEWIRFQFYAIRLMDKLGHRVKAPTFDFHGRETHFECSLCFNKFKFDLITVNHGNKVWRLLAPLVVGGHSRYIQYIIDYDKPQEAIDLIDDVDHHDFICPEIPESHIDRDDFKEELGKIPDALSMYFKHCFLHKIRFKYIVKGFLTNGFSTHTRARTCALEGKCLACQMVFGMRFEGQVIIFGLGGAEGRSFLIEKSERLCFATDWLAEASKRIRNESNITFAHPDYAHFSCNRLEILK